jgi:hypothetical protein
VDFSENSNLIKVGAIFPDRSKSPLKGKSGNVVPIWFFWDGRKYDIRNINYIWDDRQGQERIIKFSVSDGTNSYELAYNTSKVNWKLSSVC